MSTVRSRVLRVRDVDGTDLARWHALAARPLEANVFYTPDFLVPTVEHFDRHGEVRLVVVEDHDRWLAVLPFETVHAGRRWPLRHGSTDGPVLNLVTSLGSPLVLADDGTANLHHLARALRDHARELGGAVDMVYVAADGAAGGGLRRALEEQGLTVHEWGRDDRATADLESVRHAPEGFAHVPSSRLKAVRRRTRRLGEELGSTAELGTLRLDRVDDADAFLDFEQLTWKADAARDGVGLSRLPGGTSWFRDVFARFAGQGRSSVVALRVAGNTLYMAAFLLHGDMVFAWYDEYADHWSRYAPGVLGRLLTVPQLAATTRAKSLDTCMHPSLYPDQNELYPGRRTIVSYTVALRRGPAAWLLRALPVAGRVRRGLGGARARLAERHEPAHRPAQPQDVGAASAPTSAAESARS
ncbi:GNAT family N-acetyltransferase [Cellulosimicrobium cellulans]|uniref:GNAT family N-acetyltransferase n=1 Tax=Cellulosimicrobium cellulans TaxID=1710 RepID=UPI002405013B|nr:GNAT family N-acetyltransferase [Cellulosimicrobium cellulans]MDF9877536.1 hypothetical protein [Cellulosimicrobium cellulans]